MNAERRSTLLKSHPQPGHSVLVMLGCSLALFLAGIFRPFTAVTKLWVFENQISVVNGLITLLREAEIFLFLILFVFTVIFPFVKIVSLLALWLKPGLTRDQAQNLFRFVSHLGKWSMLDVFIVAILVLTVKSGGAASIRIQDGLFLFFCSVMLTQLSAMWTGRVASRLVETPS